MQKLLFLLLASLCLILPGCDQFLAPAGAYRDADLAFDYPAGWSVSARTVGPRPTDRVVSARGPDNAVLIFMCMPTGSATSLRAMADLFGKQRDERVEQSGRIGSHSFFNPGPSTLEATQELVAGKEVDGFRQTFSLSILGIEIPFEAHFLLLSNDRRTWFIVTQNPVRNSTQVQASFAAMLGSLRLLPDAAPGG